MGQIRRLVTIIWYATGLYFMVLWGQGPLARSIGPLAHHSDNFVAWLDLVAALSAGVILVATFILIPIILRVTLELARQTTVREASSTETQLLAFPAQETILVGVWLLLISLLSSIGLFLALAQPDWLIGLIPPGNHRDTVSDALITMFAAAIGGTITTILGYLKYASEKKEFEVSYLPWYVARPIMGMLLGLIFFFLLKGGLLATLPSISQANLNDTALAGIGGLVGLFSKPAIEKLRELFNVLFATKETPGKPNPNSQGKPNGA